MIVSFFLRQVSICAVLSLCLHIASRTLTLANIAPASKSAMPAIATNPAVYLPDFMAAQASLVAHNTVDLGLPVPAVTANWTSFSAGVTEKTVCSVAGVIAWLSRWQWLLWSMVNLSYDAAIFVNSLYD